MLLVDPEDRRILIRKILIGENDWSIEDSFQINYEELFETFNNGAIIQVKKPIDLLEKLPYLNLFKDQPFLNNIYAPVRSNSHLAGIIFRHTIFNPIHLNH